MFCSTKYTYLFYKSFNIPDNLQPYHVKTQLRTLPDNRNCEQDLYVWEKFNREYGQAYTEQYPNCYVLR